jgi:hypothetical protein
MERRASQAVKWTRTESGGGSLQWYDVIFDLIDMRSFSNLWYWIVLAVMWSSVSHWVLGVPFDMIARARRHGGQAQADLEGMIRITTGRLLHITRTAGLALVAILAFLLTGLVVLGFVYDVEFAQAVLFLLVPMLFVTALSLRAAVRIEAFELAGEELDRVLARHRIVTQLIGMVSIFVTSLFGMWQNMHIGILG